VKDTCPRSQIVCCEFIASALRAAGAALEVSIRVFAKKSSDFIQRSEQSVTMLEGKVVASEESLIELSTAMFDSQYILLYAISIHAPPNRKVRRGLCYTESYGNNFID